MNHPNPASSQPWRALPAAGALARRPAVRPAAPGPAAPTGMPPALPPAAAKRSRSLDHQFQPCSREASAMTMIGTRTHAGGGAPQGDTPGTSPGTSPGHRLGGGS